jgi:hypothetical protein
MSDTEKDDETFSIHKRKIREYTEEELQDKKEQCKFYLGCIKDEKMRRKKLGLLNDIKANILKELTLCENAKTWVNSWKKLKYEKLHNSRSNDNYETSWKMELITPQVVFDLWREDGGTSNCDYSKNKFFHYVGSTEKKWDLEYYYSDPKSPDNNEVASELSDLLAITKKELEDILKLVFRGVENRFGVNVPRNLYISELFGHDNNKE